MSKKTPRARRKFSSAAWYVVVLKHVHAMIFWLYRLATQNRARYVILILITIGYGVLLTYRYLYDCGLYNAETSCTHTHMPYGYSILWQQEYYVGSPFYLVGALVAALVRLHTTSFSLLHHIWLWSVFSAFSSYLLQNIGSNGGIIGYQLFTYYNHPSYPPSAYVACLIILWGCVFIHTLGRLIGIIIEKLRTLRGNTTQTPSLRQGILSTKKALTKTPKSEQKNRETAPPHIEEDLNSAYTMPSPDVLSNPAAVKHEKMSHKALEERGLKLLSVLEDFGIRGRIIHIAPGPVVTLFEFEPSAGLKSSRVVNLADDIARSMSAISARVAIIAGKNAIGIELPNITRETVYLKELITSQAYRESAAALPMILGKDISGRPVIADLSRMPHLLVAGTTGSGKSVGVNSMILSILFRHSPLTCKMVMIDPKMLELSIYDGIPHLLTPVVTDPKKAVMALQWTVREMENRYKLMAHLSVRNIDGYNAKILTAKQNAHHEPIIKDLHVGFNENGSPLFETQHIPTQALPYIVVVVDEMADLMMTAGKEIENAVQRLAQMARAAGIHLIMSTQRPSVDVITGTIKANFPTRISFQVTSRIDSRTILGEQGAEQLLGQGDMLYLAAAGRMTRVHGPFVSDSDVEATVQFLKNQQLGPEYLQEITDESLYATDTAAQDLGPTDEDPLYMRAKQIVQSERKASVSYIQRRLQIGYNRAARLIERMEEEGIISQATATGKRDVF